MNHHHQWPTTIRGRTKCESNAVPTTDMNPEPLGDTSSVTSTEESAHDSENNAASDNNLNRKHPPGRFYESDSSESSFNEEEDVEEDDDDDDDESVYRKYNDDSSGSEGLDESRRKKYNNGGWDSSHRSNDSTIASAIPSYRADGKSHISTLLAERQIQHSTPQSQSSTSSGTPDATELAKQRREVLMTNMKNARAAGFSSNPGLLSIDLPRNVGFMPGNLKRSHSLDVASPREHVSDRDASSHTHISFDADFCRSVCLKNEQRRRNSVDMAPLRDGGNSFYSNMVASSQTGASSMNIDLFRPVGLSGLELKPTHDEPHGPQNYFAPTITSAGNERRTLPLIDRREEVGTPEDFPAGRRHKRSSSLDLIPTHPRAATNPMSSLFFGHRDDNISESLHSGRPSLDLAPTHPIHRHSSSWDGMPSCPTTVARNEGTLPLINRREVGTEDCPAGRRHKRSSSLDLIPTHPRAATNPMSSLFFGHGDDNISESLHSGLPSPDLTPTHPIHRHSSSWDGMPSCPTTVARNEGTLPLINRREVGTEDCPAGRRHKRSSSLDLIPTHPRAATNPMSSLFFGHGDDNISESLHSGLPSPDLTPTHPIHRHSSSWDGMPSCPTTVARNEGTLPLINRREVGTEDCPAGRRHKRSSSLDLIPTHPRAATNPMSSLFFGHRDDNISESLHSGRPSLDLAPTHPIHRHSSSWDGMPSCPTTVARNEGTLPLINRREVGTEDCPAGRRHKRSSSLDLIPTHPRAATNPMSSLFFGHGDDNISESLHSGLPSPDLTPTHPIHRHSSSWDGMPSCPTTVARNEGTLPLIDRREVGTEDCPAGRRRQRSSSLDLIPTHPRAATNPSSRNEGTLPLVDRREVGTEDFPAGRRRQRSSSLDLIPTHPRAASKLSTLSFFGHGDDNTSESSSHSGRPCSLDLAPTRPIRRELASSSSWDGIGPKIKSLTCGPSREVKSLEEYRLDLIPTHPRAGSFLSVGGIASQLGRQSSLDQTPTHPRAREDANLITKAVIDDFSISSSDGYSKSDSEADMNSTPPSVHPGDGNVAFPIVQHPQQEPVIRHSPPPIPLTLTIELKPEAESRIKTKTTLQEHVAYSMQLGLEPATMQGQRVDEKWDAEEFTLKLQDARNARRRIRGGRSSSATNSVSNSLSSGASVESGKDRKWRACLERSSALQRRTNSVSTTGSSVSGSDQKL